MPKARQHIPDMVELKDVKPQIAQYSCLEQLLDLPWVKQWKKQNNFHRFCRSDRGDLLMVESEDGTWWWVVAIVTPKTINQLPVVQCNEAKSADAQDTE